MLKINGIFPKLKANIHVAQNNDSLKHAQKVVSSPIAPLVPAALGIMALNIPLINTQLTQNKDNFKESFLFDFPQVEDKKKEQLESRLKTIQAPDGSFPYANEKDLARLMKYMRGGEQGELQIQTLQQLLKNKYLKTDDVTNIVKLTKKADRAEVWIKHAKILGDKYKTLTGHEISTIVPNIRWEFADKQDKFIRNVYVKHKNKTDEKSLDIFCNLLSALKYTQIEDLQLGFFNKLVDERNVPINVAMNLVSNLTDEETGKYKARAILKLIDKGINPKDLQILIPKIKNEETSKLQEEMCDYFYAEKKMPSDFATKTMANIQSPYIFNVQKNLIEKISEFRSLSSKNIFRTLGDVQSKTKADLKFAVAKELNNIQKLDEENIVDILTNVENFYNAEVKVKTAKNLANIDKLNGNNITYITNGTYNDEASMVKVETANQLSQIEGMTGNAITTIVSNVMSKDTAKLQIQSAKELFNSTNFSAEEIANIVKGLKNIDYKNARFNAVNQLKNIEKINSTDIVSIANSIKIDESDKFMLDSIATLAKIENITSNDIKNIATTIKFEKHTYKDLINFISTITADLRAKISNYALVQDFYPFKDASYLDKTDKKKFMQALIKHNYALFKTENAGTRELYTFLPSNNSEYCSMVSHLAKVCATSGKKLSQAEKINYFNSLENLSKPDSIFMALDLSNIKNQPKLAYTRDAFISDVKDLTKDLTPEQATILTSHFSFSLSEHEGKPAIKGYPAENKTLIADSNLHEKSEKLGNIVSNFISKNRVVIENQPQLENDINNILKVMPELITTVQKEQNSYHDYTLFSHILLVLQNTFKNTKFSTLEENDKKLLASIALLHDVSKAEYIVDKTHAKYSALDAYEILKRLDFSKTDRSKAYSIIRNHEWLKYYNQSGISELQKSEKAKDIAFRLREGNAFDLENILSEADLKSINANESFFVANQAVLKEASVEVSKYIKEIEKTAIPLPQTKLPKASELTADGKTIRAMNIDGTENKVIYLNKNINLAKALGVASDTEDFSVLVHGLDSEKNSITFQYLNEIDSSNLLSSSYVNLDKGNWKVFRQQGFILDVDSDNIHAAYYKDFGSGDAKNVKDFQENYLFGGYFKPQRDYISKLIKEKLNISDDSYRDLYKQIKNKSFEQIKEEFPFVALAIKEIFMDMQGGEYTFGRNYNEILITRPRIQGVFAYDKSITQVPKYLREYAQNKDIPIIIFED